MAKRVKPTDVAVGVKELIELPKSVIEDRFQLQGNQGAALSVCGITHRWPDGRRLPFIPMKTPCRWGWFVVCIICMTRKKSVPQMLEDFKQHPVADR